MTLHQQRYRPSCQVRLLLAALLAVAAYAQGQDLDLQHCLPREDAVVQEPSVCSLEIVGRKDSFQGKIQPGIERVSLNCTSPSGYKVPVGVASASQNSPLAGLARDVLQALQPSLLNPNSGIVLASPSCQQAVEAPPKKASLVPLYGLLYFCEGSITLSKPIIQGLWLPYTSVTRGQDDTATVVIAGNARVVVEGAQVERVHASTALARAVLQDSAVAVTQSIFRCNVGNPGSAVFARDRAVLCIHSSTFLDSSSTDYGGAVAVMGFCNATVVESVFTNCSAALSGGALYASENSSLTVGSTLIQHNTAGTPTSAQSRGGGIFCQARFLNISNGTRIIGNTAFGHGGGVYASVDVFSDHWIPLALQLSGNTVVSGNTAQGIDNDGPSAGGGVAIGFETKFDPVVLRHVVQNNTAARDADVSIEPTQLTVLGEDTVQGYTARPAGQRGGLRVEVLVQGEGGFPCGGRNVRAYWLSNSRNSSMSAGRGLLGGGNTTGPAGPDTTGAPKHTASTNASGVAVLELAFAEPPGTHLITLAVEHKASLKADVLVEVRHCWKGEQEESPGICGICLVGKYNFELGVCHDCPLHAQCPGGAVVLPNQGFWLSSAQHNQAHRCPNPRACSADRSALIEACKDSWEASISSNGNSNSSSDSCYQTSGFSAKHRGNVFAQGQCSEGYGGNLCGKCEAGFGSIRPLRCALCYSRGRIAAMYVVASLFLLAFMKLVCYLTLRESGAPAGDNGPPGTPSEDTVEPAHLVRQLVFFSQYTLIVASVQAADSWPATIARPLQALAWIWAPASPQTLAPECLLQSSASASGVAKVLFYVTLPVVLLVVLLLSEVVLRFARDQCMCQSYHRGYRPRRSQARDSSFLDRLIAASMVVVFFFLPSIVRVTFGLFACISIDSQAQPPNNPLAVGSFWLHDTNQQCFEGWHRHLALGLGIPLLLFVCFVPGFILYKTLPSKNKLQDRTWQQHYGFLVQYYKPGFRFWEAVVAAQTITLVAISVFSYTLGPFYQAMLMNIALAVIWLVLAVAKPLAHQNAQRVAVVSMGCLFSTSYSALAFVQIAQSAGNALSLTDGEAAAIPLFMGVVVVVVNLVFVGWVVWKLVVLIDWTARWQAVCSAMSCVGVVANRLCLSCRQRLCGSVPVRRQVQGSHVGAAAQQVPWPVDSRHEASDVVVSLPADQDEQPGGSPDASFKPPQ